MGLELTLAQIALEKAEKTRDRCERILKRMQAANSYIDVSFDEDDMDAANTTWQLAELDVKAAQARVDDLKSKTPITRTDLSEGG